MKKKKKKKKKKEKVEKESEKKVGDAVDKKSLPAIPFTMDKTSVIEFRVKPNPKYSEEIIKIRSVDDIYILLEGLRKLKTSDPEKFLPESESLLNKIWHTMEALLTHTDFYLTIFQITMGRILIEVENFFGKHSDYISWLTEHFGDKHIRYFQQARQLARMGYFAEDYAALGKNRLLQVDGLKTSLKKEPDDILKDYPLPDIAKDRGGRLFSEHIDAIITIERCKAEGVDIDFDRAALLSCYENKAVKVNVIKKLKEGMDKEKNRQAFLDRVIMDKMVFPTGNESQPIKGKSLNRLLAELDHFQSKVEVRDEKWFKAQKMSEESLKNVYNFLTTLFEEFYPSELRRIIKRHDLVKKLKLNLTRAPQSSPKKKGG